jgi:hypothetical protein
MLVKRCIRAKSLIGDERMSGARDNSKDLLNTGNAKDLKRL